MNVLKTLLLTVVITTFSLFVLPSFSKIEASVPAANWVWTQATPHYTYGVTVDSSDNISVAVAYSTTSTTNMIRKFSPAGATLSTFNVSGTSNGQIRQPRDVAIDSSGSLYIAEYYNDRIQKVNSSYVYQWKDQRGSFGGVYKPEGVEVNDSLGLVYLVDTANHSIRKYNKDTGVLIEILGSQGISEGSFKNPKGIAIDSSNNIYIADTDNNRIQVFDSDFNFIKEYGSYGTDVGQFNAPAGVAVDSSGTIYIADTGNNRIQRISSTGQFLTPFGSYGTGSGQFSSPYDVDVDSTGNIYVVESTGKRLQKFSPTGFDYQVTNIPVSLKIFRTSDNLQIDESVPSGTNNASVELRLKNSSGRVISDVIVDMTEDRDWSSVTGDSDENLGKAYVNNLTSAPGTASTHTLYVPVPEGRTSESVYICPEASSFGDVSTSCTNGVSRQEGSYTESFGNIEVSLERNVFGDGLSYWKIEGITGSGGLSDDLVEYSGNGSGTELDPYEISSCLQLQEIEYNLAAYYELTSSLNCSETSTWNSGAGFIPLGDNIIPFTGSLDGNGYTISNLFMSRDLSYTGLFAKIDGGDVHDLNLSNIQYDILGTIAETLYIGGLAGYINDTEINNVTVEGIIAESGEEWLNYVGGLIGYSTGNSSITFSETDVDITTNMDMGNAGVGGFVGGLFGQSVVEDSSSVGTVRVGLESELVGGFVGTQEESSIVRRSFSAGTVYAGYLEGADWDGVYEIGGFVGSFGHPTGHAVIEDSYSNTAVIVEGKSNNDIGGFLGSHYGGYIQDSYSTEDVIVRGWNAYSVGGFAGETVNNGDLEIPPYIEDCYSKGNIYAENEVNDTGGFIGSHSRGFIRNSYSEGNVIGTKSKYIGDYDEAVGIGGFAGDAADQIEKSFSKGNVLIFGFAESTDIGGFVGGTRLYYEYDDYYIRENASFGSVLIKDSPYVEIVGGFMGSYAATSVADGQRFLNNYSRGSVFLSNVDEEYSIGGFVGILYTSNLGLDVLTISNSYSTGTVLNDSVYGKGMVGANTDLLAVDSSYWDIESSGITDSDGGVGYTTAQLKNSSNLTGWDFTDIWQIEGDVNDGYPSFQWQTEPFDIEGTNAPTIYLPPLTPNPTSDTTPSIKGVALDTDGIDEIQFQINGTVGTWSSCTADDGAFNSSFENFTCTVGNGTPFENDEYTIYVRGTDGSNNRTLSGEEESITFSVNTSYVEFVLEEEKFLPSTGDWGNTSSIAVGPDGFARISHLDFTNYVLNLVICQDKECVDYEEVVVAPFYSGNAPNTSLVIGDDGFVRIAYRNGTTGTLMIARCTDYLCTSPVLTDTSLLVEKYRMAINMSMASDGYLRVAYLDDAASQNLMYLICNNDNCTTPTVVDLGVDVTTDSSAMILDENDIPHFAFVDRANWDLNYIRCNDSSCSSFSSVPIDTEGGGLQAGISIGSDNFARVGFQAYYGHLAMIRCLNATCSSIERKDFTNIPINGGVLISLVDDLPIIGYTTDYDRFLYNLICNDLDCDSYYKIGIQTTTRVDNQMGKDMALSEDGNEIFHSYYDYYDERVGYAYLSREIPTPPAVTLDSVSSPVETQTLTITGSVEDEGETVFALHYQVDGYLYEGWTLCTADDGAFDEATEDFTCNLTGLSNGEHTVYVRAVDSAGNATVYPNHATAIFTVQGPNSAPLIPSNLSQYKSNGTTVLATGLSTDESTVILKMNISDPDGSGTLTPQVEIRPTGVAFTDTVTNTGSGLSFTGIPITAQLLITGLVDTFSYHWQARVCDEGSLCSDWVSYGLNAESASDFTVILPAQEEQEETPPTTSPTTPSPSTPPVDEEEEIVEEEVVEEEEPIDEEEEEEYTPPTYEEPTEEEEERESIFLTISNGVKELASNIAKGISNVEVSKEVSESIAVTGIAVVSTHALLTNFVTLAGTQSLSSLQLLSSFFLIGGLKRKKNQKYSLVYDSVSKEPINMATVRVMDETGKLVTTVVTDVYGVFDLKVPDGKYSFTVVGRNHSFPSQVVLGTSDDPYQNVYKGGLVEYSSNTGLNISIPMDKEEKGVLGVMFSSSRSAFVSILNVLLKLLFVVGFGMTVISLVKEPSTLIWISFGMYILLILLYVFFAYRDRRSFGVVRSTQGNMLEGLEIGVRELEFDTIYAKRVSDEKGKYRFILPGGKYRLEILNSNYELVDTENDTFEIKDGSLFIVKEDIVVRRKV